MAEDLRERRRQIRFLEQPGADGVVDVVIHVGHEVRDARNLPFERARALRQLDADRRAALPFRMLRDAVAHFPREVEPAAVVLEDVHDAQALLVVVEPARHEVVEDALAGMAERRVPEVVAERDRLGQLLVKVQHLRDGARDLRDLERVGQPRAIVVARRREEHLRLVLEAPERLRVNHAIAIALEGWTDVVFGLGAEPATRVGRPGRLRRENLPLACFELLTDQGHARMASRKLVPCDSGGTPKFSAMVWPRSLKVALVPRFTRRTFVPVTSSGTYSLAWSVLGVVGSLP